MKQFFSEEQISLNLILSRWKLPVYHLQLTSSWVFLEKALASLSSLLKKSFLLATGGILSKIKWFCICFCLLFTMNFCREALANLALYSRLTSFDFNSLWEYFFPFPSHVRDFRWSDFSSVAKPAVIQANLEEMCSTTPAVSRLWRPGDSSWLNPWGYQRKTLKSSRTH